MVTATVTDTEKQNVSTMHFKSVIEGEEVENFALKETTILYLTESLIGILKGNYDLNQVQEEKLKEKYEIIN